ncbi:MAG: hydroxymethylbilane synthase, partial [Nitrospinales bacterium]
IETRRYDLETIESIVELDHEATHTALEAERAFLEVLEGGCQVPIGALAVLEGSELKIRGMVGNLDGTVIYKSEKTGPATQAGALGKSLGRELLDMGADHILREIYA